MKEKRINTIPNGDIIILIIFILFLIEVIIGILLIPKYESIGLFIFSVISILALIDHISGKYLNYIYITNMYIRNKNEKILWENVYITMSYSRPTFKRNSFDYYIYFSNKYLTEDEIKSKKVKKCGFFLILTKKRALYLLPFYKKEVKILDESPYGKRTLDIIKSHNNNVNKYEL